MAEVHEMLVTYVAGKMQRLGYNILFMEGNHADVKSQRPELPPKIITHRPDVYGVKTNSIAIGEAKTKSDLKASRTRTQLLDFKEIVRENPNNRLFICVPQNAGPELVSLLSSLGIVVDEQIDIMVIPEMLLPKNGKV